jgi:hypothetical protein
MLLGAVGVLVVAWALFVPPFSVPDEAEHASYVQSLVENGERPPRGPATDRSFSTEERVARTVARNTPYSSGLALKPPWEPTAERGWHENKGSLPRDDILAVGPQAEHPPLYYAYETVPYAVASGSDFFGRLYAMRLWSGLLLLVTVTGAWLLIGEMTGDDRLLQLAGAGCVGLQPMSTFMSAGVNPDALLFAAYSIALWLAVRVLRRPSRAAVGGLLAAVGVAVLAKPAGLALIPAVVLVLGLRAIARGRSRAAVLGTVGAGAVLAVIGIAAERGVDRRAPVDVHLSTLRGFSTYLWDFYLPRLPFQHSYPALHIDNPAWTVWVKFAWGSFGFLEVQFPAGVYVVLAAVAFGVLVAAATAVARGRFDPGRGPLAVFGLTAVCLFFGLHWVDFQAVTDTGGRVMQGRYLLPLMPIVGVAVAAGLRNLTRHRAMGAAAVLGFMVVLQLFSLAVVAGRFYA